MRRFVSVPSMMMKSHISLHQSLFLIQQFSLASSANALKFNKNNDDGFGGGGDDDEIDIDDFVADESEIKSDEVVFIQNGTTMDYTAFSSPPAKQQPNNNQNDQKKNNEENTITIQQQQQQKQQQMAEQEASSSQFVAKIWPELLQMSQAVEASQQVVMTIEDEMSRTRQIGDGLQTQRAVEISRSIKLEKDQKDGIIKMSPQDAAFCFGVLQSVVEQSNTRLDEKFVADVSYHVFSADLLPESNNKHNSDSSSSSSLLSVTEQRAVLATATATTWRSLVSSGFINDDYLLGIGLARCVDLVDSMDVPSLCHLLEGLRKFNRTHFTLHELDHYRKNAGFGTQVDEDARILQNAGGLDDGLGGDDDLDLMKKAEVHGEVGLTNRKKKAPSLATLLREAMTADANRSNVIHPNLIDLITQGVEKRIQTLIADANKDMERLKKEMFGNSGGENNSQRLLESNTKKTQQSELTTTTTTIEIDDPDSSSSSSMENSQNENKYEKQKTSRDFTKLATFVPICRPNELLQIIAELCRIPNGVTDQSLWKQLTKYSENYFDWATQKAKFDRFQMHLQQQHHHQNSSSLLLEDSSSSSSSIYKNHHKRSLFETERLLALLPPLVKPITAINDPVDAISTSKRSKNNFLIVSPSSNSNTNDDNQLALIPTSGLLTLVSNELAHSASKHIQVIGRRNPDLIRNLRRAFEEFPVLYQTSPALWDVLRNQKLSRKIGGSFGNRENRSVTGLERNAGKLGKLPRFIPMDEAGGTNGRQRRILSRDIVPEDASQLPIVERKFKLDPDRRFKHITGRWKDLKTGNRINGWKDAKKKRKFSKGKYNATRIGEASHQQNR